MGREQILHPMWRQRAISITQGIELFFKVRNYRIETNIFQSFLLSKN